MTRRITIKPSAKPPKGKPGVWSVQADRGNIVRQWCGTNWAREQGGGTHLDELSVGEPCWLHLEAMNVRGTEWSMHIGKVMLGIKVNGDGSVCVVHQEGEIIR